MSSPQPRIGVLRFPGACDDRDAHWALAAFDAEAVFVWHTETELPDLDAVVLPGGFSYGDYLRCGAIARFAPAMSAVAEFAANGGLVLGYERETFIRATRISSSVAGSVDKNGITFEPRIGPTATAGSPDETSPFS